jgi:hypothetical protein
MKLVQHSLVGEMVEKWGNGVPIAIGLGKWGVEDGEIRRNGAKIMEN